MVVSMALAALWFIYGVAITTDLQQFIFLSAAGLPSRVRSDQGRENYLIAAHMLEHRGVERRSWQFGA